MQDNNKWQCLHQKWNYKRAQQQAGLLGSLLGGQQQALGLLAGLGAQQQALQQRDYAFQEASL